MIYVVEIPHQLPPRVWVSHDRQCVIDSITQASFMYDQAIYECATGEELLEMFGYTSIQEMATDNPSLLYLANLIEKEGVNAKFYKCYGIDEYSTTPCNEFQACLDWNARDLSMQLVFMDENEAREAIAGNFSWNFHQGMKARIELEKVLKIYKG